MLPNILVMSQHILNLTMFQRKDPCFGTFPWQDNSVAKFTRCCDNVRWEQMGTSSTERWNTTNLTQDYVTFNFKYRSSLLILFLAVIQSEYWQASLQILYFLQSSYK